MIFIFYLYLRLQVPHNHKKPCFPQPERKTRLNYYVFTEDVPNYDSRNHNLITNRRKTKPYQAVMKGTVCFSYSIALLLL